MQTARVYAYVLADDGSIPNSRLPLLIYPGALDLIGEDPCGAVEATLRTHGWGHGWRNGILSYHHYHSTAHEALVAYSGSARVQFGGEQGVAATVNPGDVVIIPAGVGHKNLAASADFRVIGAYPRGQAWDISATASRESARGDENIARAALPTADPLFGQDGPLRTYWP